jgi:hypothetical protein
VLKHLTDHFEHGAGVIMMVILLHDPSSSKLYTFTPSFVFTLHLPPIRRSSCHDMFEIFMEMV